MFSSRLRPTLLDDITSGSLPTLIANTFGGMLLMQKIGLKSAKNRVFCILFRPMGGSSPPATPPLVTLLGRRIKFSTYLPKFDTLSRYATYKSITTLPANLQFFASHLAQRCRTLPLATQIENRFFRSVVDCRAKC